MTSRLPTVCAALRCGRSKQTRITFPTMVGVPTKADDAELNAQEQDLSKILHSVMLKGAPVQILGSYIKNFIEKSGLTPSTKKEIPELVIQGLLQISPTQSVGFDTHPFLYPTTRSNLQALGTSKTLESVSFLHSYQEWPPFKSRMSHSTTIKVPRRVISSRMGFCHRIPQIATAMHWFFQPRYV